MRSCEQVLLLAVVRGTCSARPAASALAGPGTLGAGAAAAAAAPPRARSASPRAAASMSMALAPSPPASPSAPPLRARAQPSAARLCYRSTAAAVSVSKAPVAAFPGRRVCRARRPS